MRSGKFDSPTVHEAATAAGVAVDSATDVPMKSNAGAVPVTLEPNDEPSSAPAPARVRDWMRAYHESTDDFLLAQALAEAALLGDSRAAYVLGKVLLRCELHERTLAPYAVGTVAERIDSYLVEQSGMSERRRAALRREAVGCAEVFTENPFAAYDLPEEARDFRYWSNQALELGDPLAVVTRADRLVAGRSVTDDAEQDRAFREALLKDVRQVVFAGDPAALFAVGGLFAHPSVVADPKHGYAWWVAACETGYDCSNDNPDWAPGCAQDGTCVAGETRLTVLQRDLGATGYAEIYANAQDIQYKLRANDWDGLQQYLPVKD
jgi:hypothetical protein